MKYKFTATSFILSLAIFLPHTVSADSLLTMCQTNGYTISAINGIFTDEEGARNNQRLLKLAVGDIYNGQKIDYQYLLNASHLGGLEDLATSAYQKYFDENVVKDFDLIEMLKAASEKIRTQKLLIVAHSQGNFYANSFYETVANKQGGVPAQSIGVYAVATPSGRVAGGGKWLTSDTDKIIAGLVAKFPFRNIMKPNTHIELQDGDDSFGHSFTDVYLKYRGGEITSNIQNSLDVLKENDIQDAQKPCIAVPEISTEHKVEGAVFAFADPKLEFIVSGTKTIATKTYYAAVAVGNGISVAAEKTAQLAVATAQLAVNTAQSVITTAGNLLASIPFAKIGNIFTGSASGERSQTINNGLAVIGNYFGSPQSVANVVEPQNNAVATNSNSQNDNVLAVASDQKSPLAASGVESLPVVPRIENQTIQLPQIIPASNSSTADNKIELASEPPKPIPVSSPPPISIGGSGPVQQASSNSSASLTTSNSTDSTSSPQTSTTQPQTFPTINSFQASYDFAPKFNFSWLPSTNASGSTSSIKYHIYDITNPSSTVLVYETASSSASYSANYGIDEVGRNYSFKFVVEDNGSTSLTTSSSTSLTTSSSTSLSTNSTTTTVFANSFLDQFYFYKQPGASSTFYLFDITATSSRPLWKKPGGGTDVDLKMIVFYLNKDAPKEGEIDTNNGLVPSDGAHIRVSYDGCGGGHGDHELIFPKNSSSCNPGPLNGAYNFARLEDMRLAVPLASTTSDISFSSGDYVTLAFYDFGSSGGARQFFNLAAVDKTKHYFMVNAPAQNAPTTPANLAASFSALSAKTSLTWSSSTDADTLDYLITYQINYSTSSVLDASGWQSNNNLLHSSFTPVFPNTYKIGVRAVDDVNNASTPAEINWSFPNGYAPLLSQLIKSSAIGVSGGNQKILITATTTIDAVALYGEPDGGQYNNSQSYIEIRKDNNDHATGQTVGTSTVITMDQHDEARELIYTFDTPIQLEASSSYWISTLEGPSITTNHTRYYGSNSDPYPDGHWTGSDSKDAYFRLVNSK